MKQLVIILISIALTGCGTIFSIPTPTIDLTPEISGPRVRTQGESQPQKQYAGQIAQTMFSYVFAPGGLWLWQKDFEEGEWISWDLKTDASQKDIVANLAYLKEADNNRHWWKLIYNTEDDVITYEALINHDDFSTRRLRAKFGDDAPFEVPVTEESYSYYSRPRRITPEALEASIQETMYINIPAGNFQTRRAEFGVITGSGQLEMWLNDEVPGGIVKYKLTSEQAQAVGELKNFGTGAKSILNSY